MLGGFGDRSEDLLCACAYRELSHLGGDFVGKHTCEGLDLLADDIDTTVVAGVELQNHLSHVSVTIYSPRECEDCGGFPSTWRSVEKEMW